MRTIYFLGRTALALAMCSATWSQAGETVLNDIAPVEVEVGLLQITRVEPVVVSGFGVPLASGKLGDFRGGFDVVKNDMQLNGVVTNNSATDVATGSNFISAGSLANSSGFPMVVQNSGSNVLIQNATIINLQYQ